MMNEVIISILVFLRTAFGVYMIIWFVPPLFCSIRASLGDTRHIVFMDEQLAKDLDQLHSQPLHMASFAIGSRFQKYCIAFPFIHKRMTTSSKKFKVMMALNSAWFYSVFLFIILVGISKYAGIG